MNPGEMTALVFLSIFPLVLTWIWLPGIIFSFFPETLRTYFKINDRITKNLLGKENVSSTISKLESLGFHKIGTKTVQLPIWGKKQNELMFASDIAGSFASITYVNYKTIFYYSTPFSGGQIVITANDIYPSMKTKEAILSSIYKVSPEELLIIHKKHVDEFRSNGLTPLMEYTEQTRIAASSTFYKIERVRRNMRISGSIYLSLIITLYFLLFYFIFNIPK